VADQVAAEEVAVAEAGSGLPCEKTLARMGPAPEEVASVSVVSGSRWRTPNPFAWLAEKVKARNGSHATNSSTARPKCNVVNFSSQVQPAPQPLP
jgi:hypothetical protein